MRAHILLVASACAAWLLTGCNPSPEIGACETFIKAKIATPSSFKAVTTSSVPAFGEGIHGLKATDSIKLVTIEYDAQNQYGASIRAIDACAFPMINGALPSSQQLDLAASAAGMGAKIHALGPFASSPEELMEKADALDRGERSYDCCIPEKRPAEDHR